MSIAYGVRGPAGRGAAGLGGQQARPPQERRRVLHRHRRAAGHAAIAGRVRDRRCGLVAGIWYPPLGIAAAIGLVLFFVGAIGAHLRKNDFKGVPSPGLMLVAAGAALVLGVISA